MTLGVVMLTWNGEDLIERSLRSVVPYAEEVWVGDTGSTDGTAEILKKLQKDFSNLHVLTKNLQHLGKTWTGSEKDHALTGFLQFLTDTCETEWVLRIDDDEVFLAETMKEIREADKKTLSYSIPFIHIEREGKMIDSRYHPDLYVARLFRNIDGVRWSGAYGREVISYRGSRISSKATKPELCKKLTQPFLHLGEFRKEGRRHEYRFHEKGHCGLPIPSYYERYLPEKN